MGTLKAQAWGRMVPGQIGLHLSQLREQAEKLRLPEAASPSLAIRVLHYHCDHLGTIGLDVVGLIPGWEI